MSNTIFDIEQKQDSAEKLEAVQGVPTRYILFADEFNDVARKAVESAIDNISLDFSWSKKKEHKKINSNNIDIVHLLVMKMQESWILNEVDQCWLLIDRYKPKKSVRCNVNKEKNSGFKHAIYPDEKNLNRPSEILINSKEMVLDFGQEFYFKTALGEFPISNVLGYSSRNSCNYKSWVYLRFRLKLVKGDKVFFSKPKGIIEMGVQTVKDTHPYQVLSYKLV